MSSPSFNSLVVLHANLSIIESCVTNCNTSLPLRGLAVDGSIFCLIGLKYIFLGNTF